MQGLFILGAPDTAFSHVPGKPVTDHPLVANGHAALVSAIQVSHCCLLLTLAPDSPLGCYILQYQTQKNIRQSKCTQRKR